ncbi:Voltage-dependent calcium channel type D subunit alpha-1 [Diplonema papillatum]|nr:Voltage-dependent calcium channel type D subunit alpha-1 [Diplonema papillatum]
MEGSRRLSQVISSSTIDDNLQACAERLVHRRSSGVWSNSSRMQARRSSLLTLTLRDEAIGAASVRRLSPFAFRHLKALGDEKVSMPHWRQLIRFKIVQNPWFDRVTLTLITLNCIFLALEDPTAGESAPVNKVVNYADYVFTGCFAVEMVTKIAGLGLYRYSFSYVRDPWCVLDGLVVLFGVASVLLGLFLSAESQTGLGGLRAFRLLRPLRAVNHMKEVRLIVTSLLQSLPRLADVMLLFCAFILLFSVTGIQLFKGAMRSRCVQHDASASPLAENDIDRVCAQPTNPFLEGYQCPWGWSCVIVENPNFGNVAFDSFPVAALTIFTSVTMEGWTDVMYQVQDGSTRWAFPFFVTVILFGSFFISNLALVMVSIAFFDAKAREEQRGTHSSTDGINAAFLEATPALSNLTSTPALPAVGSAAAAARRGSTPGHSERMDGSACGASAASDASSGEHSCFQRKVRQLVTCRAFDYFITAAIITNTLVMAYEHHEQPDLLTTINDVLNFLFTGIFATETVLKLYAFSLREFKQDKGNMFDLVIVLLSIVDIIQTRVSGKKTGISVLRSLRLVRIFKQFKGLWTTTMTIVKSLKGVSVLTLLLLLVIFVYALLGIQLFGGRFCGLDEEDYVWDPADLCLYLPRSNFDHLGTSTVTVFQIITGEDWNRVMYSGMRSSKSPVASLYALYFVTLFIIGNYLILNLFIAVLINNFETDDDAPEAPASAGSDAGERMMKPEFGEWHNVSRSSLTSDADKPSYLSVLAENCRRMCPCAPKAWQESAKVLPLGTPAAAHITVEVATEAFADDATQASTPNPLHDSSSHRTLPVDGGRGDDPITQLARALRKNDLTAAHRFAKKIVRLPSGYAYRARLETAGWTETDGFPSEFPQEVGEALTAALRESFAASVRDVELLLEKLTVLCQRNVRRGSSRWSDTFCERPPEGTGDDAFAEHPQVGGLPPAVQPQGGSSPHAADNLPGCVMDSAPRLTSCSLGALGKSHAPPVFRSRASSTPLPLDPHLLQTHPAKEQARAAQCSINGLIQLQQHHTAQHHHPGKNREAGAVDAQVDKGSIDACRVSGLLGQREMPPLLHPRDGPACGLEPCGPPTLPPSPPLSPHPSQGLRALSAPSLALSPGAFPSARRSSLPQGAAPPVPSEASARAVPPCNPRLSLQGADDASCPSPPLSLPRHSPPLGTPPGLSLLVVRLPPQVNPLAAAPAPSSPPAIKTAGGKAWAPLQPRCRCDDAAAEAGLGCRRCAEGGGEAAQGAARGLCGGCVENVKSDRRKIPCLSPSLKTSANNGDGPSIDNKSSTAEGPCLSSSPKTGAHDNDSRVYNEPTGAPTDHHRKIPCLSPSRKTSAKNGNDPRIDNESTAAPTDHGIMPCLSSSRKTSAKNGNDPRVDNESTATPADPHRRIICLSSSPKTSAKNDPRIDNESTAAPADPHRRIICLSSSPKTSANNDPRIDNESCGSDASDAGSPLPSQGAATETASVASAASCDSQPAAARTPRRGRRSASDNGSCGEEPSPVSSPRRSERANAAADEACAKASTEALKSRSDDNGSCGTADGQDAAPEARQTPHAGRHRRNTGAEAQDASPAPRPAKQRKPAQRRSKQHKPDHPGDACPCEGEPSHRKPRSHKPDKDSVQDAADEPMGVGPEKGQKKAKLKHEKDSVSTLCDGADDKRKRSKTEAPPADAGLLGGTEKAAPGGGGGGRARHKAASEKGTDCADDGRKRRGKPDAEDRARGGGLDAEPPPSALRAHRASNEKYPEGSVLRSASKIDKPEVAQSEKLGVRGFVESGKRFVGFTTPEGLDEDIGGGGGGGGCEAVNGAAFGKRVSIVFVPTSEDSDGECDAELGHGAASNRQGAKAFEPKSALKRNSRVSRGNGSRVVSLSGEDAEPPAPLPKHSSMYAGVGIFERSGVCRKSFEASVTRAAQTLPDLPVLLSRYGWEEGTGSFAVPLSVAAAEQIKYEIEHKLSRLFARKRSRCLSMSSVLFGHTPDHAKASPLSQPTNPFEFDDDPNSSLFILSATNPLRLALHRLVTHKYLEAVVIILIAVSTVSLAMNDPKAAPDELLPVINDGIDFSLTVCFTVEAVLKILAHGFVLHRSSYLRRDPWNTLDFTIVVFSVISWTISGAEQLSIFRMMRTLRPLRFINRSPGLKLVVFALMSSIRPLANIAFVTTLVFVTFGIMGVQFYSGTFYACTNDIWGDVSYPAVEVSANGTVQHVFTPLLSKDDCLAVIDPASGLSAHRWENSHDHFDHLGAALITLFQIATLEGWVRIMHLGVDAVGPYEAPTKDKSPFMVLFFVIFIVVGSFFIINLFIGVLIEQYNTVKDRNDELRWLVLSESQRQWMNVQDVILSNVPKMNKQADMAPWRRRLFHFVQHPTCNALVTMCIAINVVFMSTEHVDQSSKWTQVLETVNLIFMTVFFIEACLKMIAHGVVGYFQDYWNKYDFATVAVSIIGLVVQVCITLPSYGY